MTDTIVKENLKIRQLGGGLLILVSLPLTLLFFLFGLSSSRSVTDIVFLLPGPLLLAAGFWAAFPRRPPRTKLIISDDALHMTAPAKIIPLGDLLQVREHIPIYAKHTRLIFGTTQGGTNFDVVNLTHQHQDIINLISVRLEKQGKYLREGRTDIRGAPNGIWEVREGLPFETSASDAKLTHGREQNPSNSPKRQ